MRPDYSDAAAWKARVEAKLAGDKFTSSATAATEGAATTGASETPTPPAPAAVAASS
jgi:hypothetical protein